MMITLSFFTAIWNIAIFLIVLGLVICIHELGHLFFAKRAGILCHEFSFGMGPRLWSKKYGETTYSIRAIPFGGYVSMAGEELESEILKIDQKIRLGFDSSGEVNRIVLNAANTKYHDFLEVKVEDFDLSSEDGKRLYINEYTVKRNAMYVMDKNQLQITPKDRSFVYKTKWQRFLTTFGGPLMNFILAFVVFLIIAFASGVPDYDSTVLAEVSENMPAYGVMQVDDQILSINGVNVTSWSGDANSVSSELAKTNDGYVFVVERDGQEVTLELIKPQLIFYGLGFTSTIRTDELTIGTPLYLNAQLMPGDEIISINDEVMTDWDDVIAFANDNVQGSVDENDFYSVEVYRTTKASVAGVVTSITNQGDFVEVSILGEDENTIVYTINNSETISVSVDDSVVGGEELSSGGFYTFDYIIYGEDVLSALNYEVFFSRVGISGSTKFSFFGSFGQAYNSFISAGTSIYKTIGLLFSSNQVSVSDLSGFVGIFSMTSQAAANGIISLLGWIGLLSVNLGIVNLLPIPALDGGRLVFIGYEAITNRKPNQKVENALHTVMFFLLMALLLFITYNDILRLFGLK